MTLKPRKERWRFGGRVTHVDYDDTRVSGAMLAASGGESASRFDNDLAQPGFDFNMIPLMLAALELKPGLALRFPQVRISPPAFPDPEIVWAEVLVEGSESVDAGPMGRVTAWPVVDPAHDMAFWMIDRAPYLVRVAFPVDDSTLSVMELGAVRAP